MNINELKNKLKPKLIELDLEGTKLYIHRPTGRDLAKCTDMASTVILCTKDENGDPIFADEDIEGRINIGSIDYVYQNQLYEAISNLVVKSDIGDIEKK